MAEWVVSDEDLGCDGAYFSYKEIVRCKDCKYWCIHERLAIPWCRAMHIDRSEEDFCSYGKKREEDLG